MAAFVQGSISGLTAIASLVIWLTLMCLVQGSCLFPEYVQSLRGSLRRDWHGHIMRTVRDSPRHYSVIATFHDDIMRTTVLGGSLAKDKPRPFERQCLQEVRPGRFLSTHRDNQGERQRYVCMKFDNRSDDVMQLSTSSVERIRRESLCDDNKLVLDEWPWVNWVNLYSSYQTCPITGGYQMKLYDKVRKKGVCDAYERNTRLESECTSGEGLVFQFKDDACVPQGFHMHKEQATFCIGSWTDDTYTYSILRHDSSEHLWCFRYPNKRGNTYVAFLFHNVHCSRERLPPTREYLRIDMLRDVARPIESLCMDDYEACEYWSDPCKDKGSLQQLVCAKQCGVCSDNRPSSCIIPHRFRGQWLENLGEAKSRITIDDHRVNIDKFGSLYCVDWVGTQFAPDANEIQRMFVQTFESGCEPRYYCVHLKKETPSILRYRLSKQKVWPFENIDPNHIDCSAFHYVDGSVPHGPKFHSRHFKTLVSESERIYVDCQFAGPRQFEVIFEDGVLCNGRLTQEGLSTRNKLKMQLDNCPTYQTEQEFACLDSTHHHIMNDQIVVTETLDTFNRIRCFLFPANSPTDFYLLSTDHCHENAHLQIQNEFLKPLARFIQPQPLAGDIHVVVVPKEHTDNNPGYSGNSHPTITIGNGVQRVPAKSKAALHQTTMKVVSFSVVIFTLCWWSRKSIKVTFVPLFSYNYMPVHQDNVHLSVDQKPAFQTQ